MFDLFSYLLLFSALNCFVRHGTPLRSFGLSLKPRFFSTVAGNRRWRHRHESGNVKKLYDQIGECMCKLLRWLPLEDCLAERAGKDSNYSRDLLSDLALGNEAAQQRSEIQQKNKVLAEEVKLSVIF